MTRPASPAAIPAPTDAGCFHCGLPFTGARHAVTIGGVVRETCCRGCQAVAETIVANGLTAYYDHRSAPAPAREAPHRLLDELGVYDLPEVQKGFVRTATGGALREAALLLEGITCAACVWLIERRLRQMPGVAEVHINYATRRARIAYDPARAKLSAILAAVAEVGYEAQPYDVGRSDAALARERRTLLKRLFVAGFGMMQVMMYAYPAYIDDGAMTDDIAQLMRLASLVLTAPVAFWSAIPFYVGAWREWKTRRLGMDTPVAIGIVGAFLASLHATWRASGDVYFDSVSMFVFLLLGARYLELGARARAAQAQERLVRLAPAVAERYADYPASGVTHAVAVATLVPGDHVLVRPGAVFPADGVIVDGASTADEALLTGESRPVPRHAGDRVTGGALNLKSPLTVRVDRVGEDSVLSAIVRLMDRAQTEKPPLATAADRIAQVFVASLLVVTLAAVAVWLTIEPARAPWIAIAILVVTCPCALSLATPAALTAATGALYQAGILVTRGHALETLARATDFVFDKTGTLTHGRMGVARTRVLGPLDEARCLALAAALEAQSEHPIARAFASFGARAAATGLQHVPGGGIEGQADGRRLRIGTAEYVGALHGLALPGGIAGFADDVTLVLLGDDRGWLAAFALDDVVRVEASEVIAALKRAGKRVHILSGDRTARVAQVASALGIEHVRGEARPEDKLDYVRGLQRAGAIVAMTGDGVNDAPVLAQAQVSAAVASGTQLAQVSADIVLMGDRLTALTEALAGAQRMGRIVRQNLAWAVVYNAVALPLAVVGWVTPLVAAVGMSVSSLTVVLNALRLLPRRRSGTPAVEQAAAATGRRTYTLPG